MNYIPKKKAESVICPKCGGTKDYRSLVCNQCRNTIDLHTIPINIKSIKYPTELGYSKASERYGLVDCVICKKEHWVKLHTLRASTYKGMCASCARSYQFGSRHPKWKGHRKAAGDYSMVVVYPDSPYYSMAKDSTIIQGGGKYILEHRLVMAQHIGRCLGVEEHVHHINGDKSDNRIENLDLISPHNHAIYTHMCAHCELRKEIRLLKWQVKELQQQLNYKAKFDGINC